MSGPITTPRSRRSSALCRAVMASCLAMQASGFAMAQSQSASKEATINVSIPAGPLDSSLREYAELAGFQLVYAPELVSGLSTRALSGSFAPRQGLEMLLTGTGLTYRFVSERTVTIERTAKEGARVLGPVRVEGAEQGTPKRGEGVAQLGGIRGGQDQEARGLRPVVVTAGVGAPTAIEDIPRSVSVLTQEQIEKQDITTMGEALKRLPGVTVIESANNNPGAGAAIVSRGFRVEKVQVDGGPARALDIVDNGLFDIGPYERIELIRGPNGAFVGDGSPGGTLNLVRKRPGMAESLKVAATGGSWDRRQVGLDYSTPSVAGSPFAFRGTASYEDTQYFYGNSRKRDWTLYGIFDAPLGEKARVELGFQRGEIAEDGSYNGIPRYAEGALFDVPRNFNYTPAGAYTNSTSSEVFGEFDMALAARWNLQVGVSYSQQESEMVRMVGGILLSQETGAVPVGRESASSLFMRARATEATVLGAHVNITGRARTFGVDHNIYVRGDFSEAGSPHSVQERDSRPIKSYLSLADLDPATFPEVTYSSFSATDSQYTSTNTGVVLGDTLSWRNLVDLNLSVRRQDSNQSKEFGTTRNNRVGDPAYGQLLNVNYSPSTNSTGEIERRPYWQPNWSLMLKPLAGLSIGGGLSNGTSPQDGRYTLERQPLGPLTYDNKEILLKYGTAAWLASLAAYDQVKTNVATSIAGTRGLCLPTPDSFCFYAQGDTIRSRGVELEMSGEILTGLSIAASYSYNDLKLVEGVVDTTRDAYTQAPSQSARAFVDWRLPFLSSTSMNLGASYQNSVYKAGTRTFYDPVTGRPVGAPIAYEFTEPARVVWDLGFSYDFSRELSMRVLIENLTNKKYLSTVSISDNFVGTPRSYLATVTWNPHRSAPASGVSPTTGLSPFGDASRWYGSFDLGKHDAGTFVGTSEGLKADGTRASWDFETESNAVAIARLGYRLADHWRIEAEGGFRGASFGKISGGGAAPNGVCDSTNSNPGSSSARPSPFNCEDSLGDANAWSLMFNGIRDFRSVDARLRPFVGLGLGIMRWSIDFGGKMKGVGPDTPWGGGNAGIARATNETIGTVDQAYSWAWQATTGASYRWTDRAYITAAYTFNQSPHVSWETFNAPTLTPTLGNFKAKIEDQSLTLGVHWFFGESALHH